MNLYQARQFYSDIGYKYIDVPTLVDPDVINSTIPEAAKDDFKSLDPKDLYHVASAEQSFIQILKDFKLPSIPGLYPCPDSYQAITACHRPCDANRGELYKEWFLKLELFDYNPNMWKSVLYDAKIFYKKALQDRGLSGIYLSEQETDIGIDLMICDIEIGSYGKRDIMIEEKRFQFSYGTGFVPFRFEKAIEKCVQQQ